MLEDVPDPAQLLEDFYAFPVQAVCDSQYRFIFATEDVMGKSAARRIRTTYSRQSMSE